MRNLKPIARFYRGILLPNLFVTLVSVGAIALHRDQAYRLIGTFFWGKMIALAIIIYVSFMTKKKELYYYQNLGISRQQLFIITWLVDFSIWVVAMVIVLFIHGAIYPLPHKL